MDQDCFLYEIHSPDTDKRQFTGSWRVVMRIRKKLHARNKRVRIWKAPVVGELTVEKMANLMNIAVQAQANREEAPLFANSVIVESDFANEEIEYVADKDDGIKIDGVVRLEDIEPGRGPSSRDIREL